jgi:heme iron utilization protein
MISILIYALLFTNPGFELISKGQDATLCTDFEGTPFGSLVIYALDEDGSPIILISDIAQHTDNILKNPKASIMVSKVNQEDIFDSQRITLIGEFSKVTEKEREAIQETYLKKYPDSEYLTELNDFNFYRMKVNKVYFIGGFGKIFWIESEDYYKWFNPEK